VIRSAVSLCRLALPSRSAVSLCRLGLGPGFRCFRPLVLSRVLGPPSRATVRGKPPRSVRPSRFAVWVCSHGPVPVWVSCPNSRTRVRRLRPAVSGRRLKPAASSPPPQARVRIRPLRTAVSRTAVCRPPPRPIASRGPPLPGPLLSGHHTGPTIAEPIAPKTHNAEPTRCRASRRHTNHSQARPRRLDRSRASPCRACRDLPTAATNRCRAHRSRGNLYQAYRS
jgi:hypothetical protein